MVKLTQMVGRLLRRESDSGRITVFDRRLASTSYGQRMLRSLPPFTKVIEPLTSPA
jgi:ATP-dependent DNA helicase DinG